MSEKLKIDESSAIAPFALQFMEAIPQAELEEVGGKYNDKLQVWEYGDGKLSEAFPVASFPGVERPGTISTVPTRITPTITRGDPAKDD